MPEPKNIEIREISPDKITRNPDNPRLIFRGEELESLMMSINRYGIQVPITVYKDGDQFVLIDGERRWRCALKLNLKKVPALVQEKPSPLDNLLLMFNIHALREQWDFYTIANKLPVIIQLFADEHGYQPNEAELSEATGLTRGQIRRCRLLLNLPETYRDRLLDELELPKSQQKLSEDFFIEMERALKTVTARLPAAIEDLDQARDSLIDKYIDGTIGNITDLRKISKIATSVEGLGIEKDKAIRALEEIFDPGSEVAVAELFERDFEIYYGERKVYKHIDSLVEYLLGIEDTGDFADEGGLAQELLKLREAIDQVLGER